MEYNVIYNEDCFAGMQRLIEGGGKVDLIITDPPYLHHEGGHGTSPLGQRAGRLKDEIAWITKDFDWERCFNMFLQLQDVPNMLIFCSNMQVSRTMKFFEDKDLSVTLLVWQKLNPIPVSNMQHISDVEFVVYVRGKGATWNNDVPHNHKKKIYTSGIISNADRVHPTQKGIDHIRQYIQLHSKPNDIVFDPFMGSGTTALAAIKEKRRYLGFELEQKYYDICNERIKNLTSQQTLF